MTVSERWQAAIVQALDQLEYAPQSREGGVWELIEHALRYAWQADPSHYAVRILPIIQLAASLPALPTGGATTTSATKASGGPRRASDEAPVAIGDVRGGDGGGGGEDDDSDVAIVDDDDEEAPVRGGGGGRSAGASGHASAVKGEPGAARERRDGDVGDDGEVEVDVDGDVDVTDDPSDQRRSGPPPRTSSTRSPPPHDHDHDADRRASADSAYSPWRPQVTAPRRVRDAKAEVDDEEYEPRSVGDTVTVTATAPPPTNHDDDDEEEYNPSRPELAPTPRRVAQDHEDEADAGSEPDPPTLPHRASAYQRRSGGSGDEEDEEEEEYSPTRSALSRSGGRPSAPPAPPAHAHAGQNSGSGGSGTASGSGSGSGMGATKRAHRRVVDDDRDDDDDDADTPCAAPARPNDRSARRALELDMEAERSSDGGDDDGDEKRRADSNASRTGGRGPRHGKPDLAASSPLRSTSPASASTSRAPPDRAIGSSSTSAADDLSLITKVSKAKRLIADALADEDEAAVLKIIDKLAQLPMSVAVLQKTGIGKELNDLRHKTSDPQVNRAAKALVKQWKDAVSGGAVPVPRLHVSNASPPSRQSQRTSASDEEDGVRSGRQQQRHSGGSSPHRSTSPSPSRDGRWSKASGSGDLDATKQKLRAKYAKLDADKAKRRVQTLEASSGGAARPAAKKLKRWDGHTR